MSRRTLGWVLVGVQFALLGTIAVLPGRDDWPTPLAVDVVGVLLVVCGLGLAAVAARHLGAALTPTPVPREGASMVATGIYRHVRHPIYTGLLVAIVGWVLRSGSVPVLAVGAITAGFFRAKSGWEDRQLAERYAGYAAYAEHTPRFVPAGHRVARDARR